MKRLVAWLGCAALAISLTLGCALYRNDRSYVPDQQYEVARQFFIKTGSLDLTEKHLHDLEWRRSEINETIYRLKKEFEVLPEEVPAQ